MKKPTKKNAVETLNYDERLAPERRAAMEAAAEGFVSDIKKSKAALSECVNQGKLAVNSLRAAGLKYNLASDKNQYDLYFFNHFETMVRPEDRKLVTREVVKTAIHFAAVIENPVTSAAEAAPFIQKVQFAFGFDQPGKRQLENAHPPRNIFTELMNEAKTVDNLMGEWFSQKELRERDAEELDEFLRDWRSPVEKYQQVADARKKI